MQELIATRDEAQRHLESAPPEQRAELKESIAIWDTVIQQEMEHPYSITAEAMDEYHRDIFPYLVPRGEGIYESEQIYAETMGYAMQWLEGGISMEQFAQRLDAFLSIAAGEDQ